MKRFAVLFAAGVFLITAAGCENTGGGPATPPPPAATTELTPAPTGKAAPKDSVRRAGAAAATANPNGPKNDR
jgi:hypothetical protein